MRGFVRDIEQATEDNRAFRQVLFTGPHLQLVVMSLAPGEDIGEEVHETSDQFFRVQQGVGVVSMEGRETRIEPDTAIVIPAGMRHNIVNTGTVPLKLYTLYAPPQHADGTVHRTRADAEAAEHVSG